VGRRRFFSIAFPVPLALSDFLLAEGASPIFFGPRTPDFLSRFVALSNSMRLSLMKAAHVVVSDAA
jgi:hypothetical protein